MDNNEIQQLTETISRKYFGCEFQHKAYFNNRLKTTGGRYILNSHNIEINEKQFIKYGESAIIDIIKHELCHYYLHIQGKGYKHKDADFKVLSKQTGAPRFCAPLKNTKNEQSISINVKTVVLSFRELEK